MTSIADRAGGATHDVTNQATALEGHDVFSTDRVLVEALDREGGGWAAERAREVGRYAGAARTIRAGFEANENPPRLTTHDRFGHRIDEVAFHPAYHDLLGAAVGFGLHSIPWAEAQPGAQVARAAMFACFSQAEAGVGCPISMTSSVIPALRAQPELAAEWEPRFTSRSYEPELRPAADKPGALCGMAMTEKQGGSDVRANTTVAVAIGAGGPGEEYELTGHKWFCSAPMCDAFLVLAQAEGGLSCFLLPRFAPDGDRNRFHIQRLKDKLGNRSNASSEIELRGAWARLVGEEGRGVQTIIEMVNHTRLDCVIGAAAGIRLGTAQAIHHASGRSAFGKLLIDQPLMQNVLADLAVESEAATISAMRLARAYDEAADGDADAAEFKRLATAVLKYWTCKRAPGHSAEALECLGGNGYVEESGMPRLYRESPLNGVWEGSGNVQCLDALRAMGRSPACAEAVIAEVSAGLGANPALDDAITALGNELASPEGLEYRARRVVEQIALCLQGSLMVRFGDEASADAFCLSRLAPRGGLAYGTLPAASDFGRIIGRAAVEI